MYIATTEDFMNHYYDYLSVNMDPEVVIKLMESQQLLNKNNFVAVSSDYQKNCLILQQISLMNVKEILSFSKLLLTSDSQKHIGQMLIKGEISSSYVINYKVFRFSHMSSNVCRFPICN